MPHSANRNRESKNIPGSLEEFSFGQIEFEELKELINGKAYWIAVTGFYFEFSFCKLSES